MNAEILLVDDERPILTVLSTALRAHGHTVRTAETAQEALGAFREQAPDVMLLDISLPDLTGWELLRRLTPAERDRTPLIVFSASPLARTRVEEFKPAGVLTKPFPIDALLRLVDEVASRPVGSPTAGRADA